MSELTYERAIEIFRYDAENGLLERKLPSGRWRACGHKPNRFDGRSQIRIDGKKYFAHRVIWLLVYGSWPEHEIDHLDRNPLNNRIANLRAATPSENQHNKGLYGNNSSGYPGVCFDKWANKFMAQIGVNGKNTNLGRFNTAEEAFLAYQLAKIEHHPSSPIAQEYLRELTVAG